ncbi:fluconazole resistance protein [Podospora appendiculata]|uniref:Fluconazole resistance protein n=1 Tax=Podospora appendiculata TaxID=314037 RepID=A0AAE1CBL7_9PEZI|nr:fluconazole resistance protein [Podospora appendiculata]
MVVIAVITFLSSFASTIISPCVGDIMHEFGSTNGVLASFVSSVYLFGYAFGPLVIAPLSEMYGRAIVYGSCIILFLVFNAACALAHSLGLLIGLRLLAGIAGSCPLTVGAASIADMFPRERCGLAMAAWVLGPLLGPTIAPIIGGYLAPAMGWRWGFWVVVLLTTIPMIFTLAMRESYAYVILKQKTKRLQKETGNESLRSALDTGKTPTDLFIFSIVRPIKMLFMSPIVLLLSIYATTVYGYVYIFFTTLPRVFEARYGFSKGATGLSYLGIGIGMVLGLVFAGAVLDRLLLYLTTQKGGNPLPEYRLPVLIVSAFLVPIGLFWYAWTAEFMEPWILPIIGSEFMGAGTIINFMSISTYLVDAYTTYAASAVAAATVLRSLLGALLPLAGNRMFDTLGVGWGVSVMGFVAVAFVPMPFILYFYGRRIRESKLFRVEF